MATHIEKLENLENSGNLRVVRENQGKKQKSAKNEGKCVLACGQLSIVLDTKFARKEFCTG